MFVQNRKLLFFCSIIILSKCGQSCSLCKEIIIAVSGKVFIILIIIFFSGGKSTLEVGSSIKMRELKRAAKSPRANANRCFCPTDRADPLNYRR